MTVQSPAKINLDLRVGPPREDGFHPIRSWFVKIGLFDTLIFEPANRISLSCDDPTIPTDAKNLVWRAADLIGGGRGVSIHLAKQIPAGGGLGGGSSNAATTLATLNKLWNLGHSVEKLAEMGATLGSDVPFFLHGPSSICEGRGEIITPTPPPEMKWVVLLLPGIHMSTPAVFKRLDELRSFPPPLEGGGKEDTFVNDLEWPAFDLSPELVNLRQTAETAIGQPVRMSGSGSTLFSLYSNRFHAGAAAVKLGRVCGVRTLVCDILSV